MKITDINHIFRKLAERQLKYRWVLLGTLIFLTAIGAAGLKQVHTKSSSTGWFDKKEAIEIATDKFEERFGNNDTVGILVEAEDVFAPEVLLMIRNLGEALLMNVPYADDVTSLTELEVSVGTAEGIAVINPFGEGIPAKGPQMEAARELILSRNSLADKLVSSDCRETWISLALREYPEEGEWEDPGKDPMFEAGEAAIAVVTDPRWESNAYTIKAAGMPYTETEERDFMGKEAATRVIGGFAVMVILLALFLHSFRGVIIPIFTTFAGIAVVFGFMGWLNVGIDSTLMTLPLLLGMALSVGYSIHLVNSFKKSFRQGIKRKEAVVCAVEKTGWPILFTVLTTIGSMLSFTVIGIAPVRWLGFSCAAVVLTVYVYIILLIPVLFSFGKDRPGRRKQTIPGLTRTEKGFRILGNWILGRRKIIGAVFLICVMVALPGIRNINVNIDSFKFMGMKIPYIQRVYSIVTSQLGSYLTYNITISFPDADRVKEPEVLKNFDRLLTEVGQFELTKKNHDVPKIFSVLDIVKDMNQTLNGDDPSFYRIPDSRDMIAQMLFLYEMSGGTNTYDWVDEEYSVLRAQVEIYKFDSSAITYELNKIEDLAEELFPKGELAIVGSAVRFAEMNDRMVISELKSFFTALTIITILLALVFASFSTGLIGLIPNLTPVIAIGGIMGYFDFQLDMMTMIIMPMLLGIAVDDTIHFINQIKYEFEICGNYKEAIINAFSSVGKTLAMTTVILSFSFGAYISSLVQTMHNVGVLAPLGLLTALLSDYLITPILIYWTRPFGKESRESEAEIKKSSRTQLIGGSEA